MHPKQSPELLTTLWFAGIPCCSIYVPVHIAIQDIFNPYETGEAWNISLKLLDNYSHGELVPILERTENVILNETEKMHEIINKIINRFNKTMVKEITELLTYSDYMQQYCAFTTQKIILDLAEIGQLTDRVNSNQLKFNINNIKTMWMNDYYLSIDGMELAVIELEKYIYQQSSNDHEYGEDIYSILENIMIRISKMLRLINEQKIKEAKVLINSTHPILERAEDFYSYGVQNISNYQYSAASENFKISFVLAENMLLSWPDIPNNDENSSDNGNGGTDGNDSKNPADNSDDVEKEPDIPDIDDDSEPNSIDEDQMENPDTKKDSGTILSNFDYMILSGLVILIVLVVALNKSHFRGKKKGNHNGKG
jgi:hypothetical protein